MASVSGFRAVTSSTSWSKNRPARADNGSALLATLGDRAPTAVLEFGPGRGDRAACLLQHFRSTDYLGFEPSSALVSVARGALATFAERANVEGRNLAIPLPLESGSADLALCLDLLEYLRMDELYMTISEARRTLRPGSLCIVRCLSSGRGWSGWLAAKTRTWFPRFFAGARPLEINHYISPENWRVILEERVREGWLSRQTVMMELLPALAAKE
jgi:SAM-dependent methyltransferase